MELKAKENYLATKFSLDNLKQVEHILKNRATFTGFDRIGSSKDIYIKEYFDTPDLFLQDRGITINKNTIKGSKQSELVVRFDTGRERKQFLSNIPDTFCIQIGKKDSIFKYTEFISASISELVPNGLSVDPMQIANSLTKICTVTKKRETNRYINIKGLKLDIHASKALFESNISRAKEEIPLLEIISHDFNKSEDYKEFIKKLSFNNPTLIRIKDSDIEIAKENLFKENKK